MPAAQDLKSSKAVPLARLLLDDSAPDMSVTGIAVDSRKVEPGYIFVALKGTVDDGLRYVPDALKRGAKVILVEEGVEVADPGEAIVLKRRNARQLMAHIAARYFGRQPESLVAITGTNGKSSVADMWRQMAGLLGHRAASIGTLGIKIADETASFGLTTPDSITLHKNLAALSDRGVTHAIFEASSHGLAQYRVDGVRIKAAAFTNLTRDHLDYHASFEDYLFAKLRLAGELLPPGGTVVVNADSSFSAEVESIAWARGLEILSVGERGTHLTLLMREARSGGQRLHLRFGRREYNTDLPLIGDFQASNALVAAGLLIAVGEPAERVIPLIGRLNGVPGRMQYVGRSGKAAAVYVDFAHTPDGLETVLRALRPHVEGQIHLVFGAGGDRDRGKRPEMGRVAAKHADKLIVTDDNPRSEDPAQVRAAILEACPDAEEIADRAEAIARAISNAGDGDAVLIAGKGHESGQIVGDKVIPFDDVAVARAALGNGEVA